MSVKTNFWLAIILVGTLLTTACSNDDEPEISAIVGTWNFGGLDIDIKINDKALLNYLVQDLGYPQNEAVLFEAFLKSSLTSEVPLNNASITFKADGSFEVKENGTVQETGTYELNAAKTLLKLTSGGTTDELEVLELSQSRMVIQFSEIDNDDISEDGVPEKIEVEVTVRFTR
jgi:hypothetical protein